MRDLVGILDKNRCFDIFQDCQLDGSDVVLAMKQRISFKFKKEKWVREIRLLNLLV